MEPEKKSNGALVGSIVIILILLVGGVYLWKSSMREEPAPNYEMGEEAGSASGIMEAETELEGLDLEGLDEGL